MSSELAAIEPTSSSISIVEDAFLPEQIVAQVQLIQQVMAKVMKKDHHFGVIPGTGSKPTLLKPGAEKLCLTFRLRSIINAHDVEIHEFSGGHREYRVSCHICNQHGEEIATGLGSCSTMETRYRFRKAEQTCPKCGKPAIIKGKQQYGGGWLCFKKKGGCGAKFSDGDTTIENQEMGRIEHDNPADYYNTCLKMARKRAQVDGTLTATAASDMFTQDVEDMGAVLDPQPKAAPKRQATVQPPQRRSESQQAPAGPPPIDEDVPWPEDPAAPQAEQQEASVFTVELVTKRKEGTNKKGNPWTMWAIKLSDGNEYTTFDESIKDRAEEAAFNDFEVECTFEQNGQYTNLVALEICEG